jgi:hypothetical protein
MIPMPAREQRDADLEAAQGAEVMHMALRHE